MANKLVCHGRRPTHIAHRTLAASSSYHSTIQILLADTSIMHMNIIFTLCTTTILIQRLRRLRQNRRRGVIPRRDVG
jgi:hypothetical protein